MCNYKVKVKLMTLKESLEKMMNTVIEKIEEEEEKLIVYVEKNNIGRAVGPNGSVVKATELIIGKAIEIRSI